MFRQVTGLHSVPEFSPPALVLNTHRLNSLEIVQQPPHHLPGVLEAGVQEQALRGPLEKFQGALQGHQALCQNVQQTRDCQEQVLNLLWRWTDD